jgi:hypothetical protein
MRDIEVLRAKIATSPLCSTLIRSIEPNTDRIVPSSEIRQSIGGREDDDENPPVRHEPAVYKPTCELSGQYGRQDCNLTQLNTEKTRIAPDESRVRRRV